MDNNDFEKIRLEIKENWGLTREDEDEFGAYLQQEYQDWLIKRGVFR